MSDPETDTPAEHEPPELGRPGSRLTVSTAAEAAWQASMRTPSEAESEDGGLPDPASVHTGRRGLIVSAVHEAASAQSNAAAALQSEPPASPDDPADSPASAEPTASTAGHDSADHPEPRRIPLGPALRGLSAALLVVYGTVLAWAVPLIGSGWLAPWPMYVGMGVAGAVAIAALRPARAQILAWLALFWVAWIVTLPLGAYWDPEIRASSNAQDSVYASALTMLALVGLGLARPGAFRWLWLSVVVTTLPIAIREAVWGDYLYPWHGVAGAPVAVFVNPNNYATILVLAVGISLGWMSERITRPARWALGALAAVCAWLVTATQSRAALVALALVIVASAVLAAERHRPRWRRRIVEAARRAVNRGRRTRVALVGAALALPAAIAAAALAALVFPGDDETLRSDGLRAEMVSFALDRWWEHPWFGTGAGTFERLWAAGPSETPRPWVPPHNAFAEILSESGLVVTAPLVVLLVLLAWYAARPLVAGVTRLIARLIPETEAAGPIEPTGPRTPSADRAGHDAPCPCGLDRLASRHLVAMHLIAFVLAGVVISSPLAWFPWWLMLSGAVAVTVTCRRPAIFSE